eukprot:396142-Pelagomonas_calceolata.AAC.6
MFSATAYGHAQAVYPTSKAIWVHDMHVLTWYGWHVGNQSSFTSFPLIACSRRPKDGCSPINTDTTWPSR